MYYFPELSVWVMGKGQKCLVKILVFFFPKTQTNKQQKEKKRKKSEFSHSLFFPILY